MTSDNLSLRYAGLRADTKLAATQVLDDPQLADLNPGESFDHMLIQFDFSEFGGSVTVEPPPAADVTDYTEIEDMFSSMFGDFEV